jgi:hypothetical protein
MIISQIDIIKSFESRKIEMPIKSLYTSISQIQLHQVCFSVFHERVINNNPIISQVDFTRIGQKA